MEATFFIPLHMRLSAILFFSIICTAWLQQPTTCSQQTMAQLVAYMPNRTAPVWMAHRMAPPAVGFAENSVSALQKSVTQYPCAIVELDVRMTADSVLLLLHDDTLSRTTTGNGKLNQQPFAQIQQLWLKDSRGQILSERIPTLDTILSVAASSGAFLALDMKPGTHPESMMQLVAQHHMLEKVMVICYTIGEAQRLHQQYPNVMLALGFNDAAQIAQVQQSGIPGHRLIALTPRALQPTEYYKGIHRMNIPTSFSAFGGLDTLSDQQLPKAFQEMMQRAGDIVCTDSLDRMMRLVQH